MPSIGSELRTYLKAKSTITDLIGAGDDARVYKDKAKQGAPLPYIVYQVFDGTSAEHLMGIAGIATNRIQVDAYADKEESAYDLAELIRLAPLQMFRGTMGATFVNNVTSDGSYDSGSNAPSKGSDQLRYWTSRDYIITYQEPTQ